jgi:hypothetical protein
VLGMLWLFLIYREIEHGPQTEINAAEHSR